MKTLIIGLLLALAVGTPCVAQTTAPSALPTASTLGSGDLVVGVQGGQLVIISQAKMQAWAQGNSLLSTGTYTNPSWLVSIPFSKLTSTPTSLNGYGITDPVVLTTGAYTNPSWITSLPASKITGLATYVTTSGTNTYTATPSPALTSYATGLTVRVTFGNANTGGASLNLNSLGAVPIQQAGAALTSGQIVANATFDLVYDGTDFQIVGVAPATYALPTATTSVLGGVKLDGSSITISGGVISATAYTLPTATTSVLGGIKVDGTTITISGGVISAAGGGGTITGNLSVSGTGTIAGALSTDGGGLTTDGTGDLSVTGAFATDGGAIASNGIGGLSVGGILRPHELIVGSGVTYLDGGLIFTNGLGYLAITGGGLGVNGPASFDTGAITTDGSGNLTVVSLIPATLFLPQATPASSSDTGAVSQVEYDSSYIYVCVGTNTWKRAALSTW